VSADRVFSAAEAKGGAEIKAATTALLLIEYQNEFTTEGGKLHDAVKDSMVRLPPRARSVEPSAAQAATGMLEKSAKVAAAARDKGVTVIHAPISFAADGSDNPNKGLGILAGCAADKLFTAGEWGAEFHASMAPAAGDLVVEGKKGLDAFPGTNLEQLLVENKIESVALSGFLTNCCVESSMRTAYEKGFNTITLTDLCATTSPEGQTGATEGTFGMFSAPMTGEEFLGKL
jgi:nicotinamidase-related amidase